MRSTIGFTADGAPALLWDMQARAEGGLRPWLRPYSEARNMTLIKRAYRYFRQHISEEEQSQLAAFSDSLSLLVGASGKGAAPQRFRPDHVQEKHMKDTLYAAWPDSKQIPRGWRTVDKPSTREDCLQKIEQLWTNPHPLSLRRRMEEMA